MRIRLGLFVALIFLSFQIIAQRPSVSVQSSNSSPVTGEYFQITVSIEGGNPTSYKEPDFGKLERSGGASTSTQMSIVNGKTTQKKSYAYTVVATTPGTITIGSAVTVINGKSYRSAPLKLSVRPGANSKTAGRGDVEQDDVFIKMELSDSVAFVGQQVILKYTIYTKSDVRSMDFMKEPEYDGFFTNHLRNYRDKEQTIKVNGKNYTKKTIRTYALFPQRTGTFIFDPATINIGIPTSQSRKTFFYTTNLKNIRLQTNEAKITVKSTPPNAPESFSGAIGSFTMRAQVDKRTLTTDDALTVRMQIDGKGDGRFLQAPKQKENPDFDFYDPNVIDEKASERGDQIRISKSFEYLIVPKRKGNFRLQPEFSYFDIDSMKYRTLTAGPFPVRVAQGSGSPRLENINKEEELAGPIMSDSISTGRSFFLYSMWYWLALLLPLGYLGYVLFQKKKQKVEAAIDPNAKRQSAANKLAQQRLTEAKAHLSGDDKSFFESLYNGLFGYVADKLLIPASQLNKNDIAQKLESKDVPTDIITDFNDLLSQCQMAIYGIGKGIDKNSLFDRAVNAITNLESALNKEE